jgi:protocatechuate 3,4-dioxygenase beta subunit
MVGALGAVALAACSSGAKSTGTAARPTTTPGGDRGLTSCTLAPEVTQGPFFLTDHPDASSLVQDRKGTPLVLTLAVVGRTCAPIAKAKVDIWHCDAAGEYGGISSSGGAGGGGGPSPGGDGAAIRGNRDTWLQGYQVADADGRVAFATVYPGWYPGRAVHIHVKVFVGGRAVHTGQLFFPDDLSQSVFAHAPYRGTPDTLNDADSIYRDAGSAALLDPQRHGAGYAAHAQLVVT